MKVAVRYFSKSGNTRKLAYEIAKELDSQALDINHIIEEEVDILFIGAATYAFDMAPEIKDFLYNLNPDLVSKIAIFTTAARKKSIYSKMTEVIRERGILVSKKYLHVPSKFLFLNKNRPGASDLEKAREFARIIIGEENENNRV